MTIKNIFNAIYNSFLICWKTSKHFFALRFFIQSCVSFFPIILLYLSKLLIDKISNDYFTGSVVLTSYIQIILFILAISLLVKIFDIVNGYISEIHRDKIRKYIEIAIINKTRSLDISFFDSPHFYNELLNISTDSYALDHTVWLSMDALKVVIQFVTAFILLFNVSVWMSFVVIALFVPYFLCNNHYILYKYKWNRDQAPNIRKRFYISYIFKNRETAKESRIFNYGKTLLGWYNNSWQDWFKDKKKILDKETLQKAIFVSIPQVGIVAIWLYIISRILIKQLTIGDFSLYTGMLTQLGANISGLAVIIASISSEGKKFANYNKFMRWDAKVKDQGTMELCEIQTIEFQNVSFKYPNAQIYALQDVSFIINSCDKVALVGENGAGKTTIINLLLRLYDPESGKVLINGINIKEYSLATLRKKFSVLLQDFPHYAFTLKESIALADWEKATDIDSINRACERVGLENLIKKMPKGLDTHITRQFDSKDGVELSVGEKQKIALARAFYRDSNIIILDEPSSALDAKAEKEIFDIIHKHSKDKIALFVSHRLSNVVNADKIIVLSNGVIKECGNHHELIRISGLYSELFNIQAQRYKV